jgi:8-oxo-dGTP pyrophosphatase MutT (NUDIX family)
MTTPLVGTYNGQRIHYSVGGLIQRGGSYLLIDRRVRPLGFAAPAGHVDEGETAAHALVREVSEETGLLVQSFELAHEEFVPWNVCVHNVEGHYWYVYTCEVSGEITVNTREAYSAEWFLSDELDSITLEPVWQYWFEQLGILTPRTDVPT